MTDLSGAGARVLLLATSTHYGPTLTSVPSVASSFHALRAALVQRCGVRPDRLRPILDPPHARAMALAVSEEARRAETVLLVYFIGHGLLGPGGELFLAASNTDRLDAGLAEHQALSFSSLRQAVEASRASSVVVVLDCCFSGRVSLGGGASPIPALATEPTYGLYLIGSAEQLALAPPDATRTAFTGALLDVLERGDPRGPRLLTLDAVYDAVFRAMRHQQRPLPRRQSGDRSGNLIIAPNPVVPAQASPPDSAGPTPGRCPYPGLDAFEVDDADVFFGRERMTRRLLAGVAASLDEGPLVLVGPSGSGKTSLLNAGLMAELRREGLPDVPGSAGWPCLRLTPGASPLRRLAGLLDATKPDVAGLLQEDPGRAVELVNGLLADRPGQRLIILVDQLEELFTLCPAPSERVAFLRAVTALAERDGDDPPPGLVVLALRADFYGQAAAHPELFAALRDRPLLVEPMAPDELRAAIEQPAATAGLALDDGLSEVILHELGASGGTSGPGQPATGALPLLSHVLWATWRQRAGSRLTVGGYRAAGGVSRAIATTAEQVYAGLDAAGQDAARRMLSRLVRVGEDTADTAQPAALAALTQGLPDTHAAQRAIDRLTEARLLTLDRDTARISHEALLRAWPRLRDWLDADRDWLRASQQLTDDARAWERAGRDPSLLYRGNRLAALGQRAAEAPASTTSLEPAAAEFIDASWRAERRGVLRRRLTVTVLTALLVVAVGALGIAAWQSRLAARQRDLASARAAGQAADRLRSTDPALAMQLALAARHVADTPEARTSLYNSALAPYDTLLTGHTDRVGRLAYSLGRHLLVSSSNDHTVRLWDLTDLARPRTTAVIHTDADTDSVLSPDGRLLAAGNTGTAQQLWDITNIDKPVLAATLADARGRLSFSPDGHLLAAVNKDALTLWDLTDPGHPARIGMLAIDAINVMSCSFSSDGHTLAAALGPPSGNERGNYLVQLWDVTDPRNPTVAAALADTHAFAVAFSPRGPLLAVGGNHVGVHLWDTTTPTKPVEIQTPTTWADLNAPTTVAALAFSQDGRTLAAGVSAGSVNGAHIVITDIANPREPRTISTYPMPTLINSIVFGDDTAVVLNSGADSIIRFWHRPLEADLPKTWNIGIPNWTFTPDSHILAMPEDTVSRQFQLWRTASTYDTNPLGALTAEGEFSELIAVNNHTLLEGNKDGLTRLWDITDPAKPMPGSTLNNIQRLGAGADATSAGQTLAINGEDGLIHLWDITDPRSPTPLSTVPRPEHPGGVYLSEDGRTLFAIDTAGNILLWDITNPRRPTEAAQIKTDDVIAILVGAIGGPGKQDVLAVATSPVNPHEIQLWDLSNIRNPVRVNLPPLAANEFTLSHDGRTLAVATDNTVDLWDISDIHHPAPIASLAAPAQANLTFSPDGHRLVSAVRSLGLDVGESATSELHIWDVADPHHATVIGTPTLAGAVNSLDFSPDGTMLLVSANSGAKDRVWLLEPDVDHLTKRLCEAIGDTLTAEQWQQYFPGTPYDPPCR